MNHSNPMSALLVEDSTPVRQRLCALKPVKGAESPRSAQLSGGKGEMVLVADDEQSIRDMVGKFLEGSGYRTILARNGLEALALFNSNAREIKAVVIDMVMPEMNGLEAISAMRGSDPNLPVLGMSGSMETSPFPDDNGTAFLRKPFSMAEFLTALRTVLSRRVVSCQE